MKVVCYSISTSHALKEAFETHLVDVTVDGRPCHLCLWDTGGQCKTSWRIHVDVQYALIALPCFAWFIHVQDLTLIMYMHCFLLTGLEDYDRIRPLAYPDTDVLLLCFMIHDDASLLVNINEKVNFTTGIHRVPIPTSFLTGCAMRLLENFEAKKRCGNGVTCV